jgi:hypothetical protein
MHDFFDMFGGILGLSDSSSVPDGLDLLAFGADGDLRDLIDRLGEACASGDGLEARPEVDITAGLGPLAANLGATHTGMAPEHDLLSSDGSRTGEWNDLAGPPVTHAAAPPGVVVNQEQHINVPPTSKDSGGNEVQRDLGAGVGGAVAGLALHGWLGADRRAGPSKPSSRPPRSKGDSQPPT